MGCGDSKGTAAPAPEPNVAPQGDYKVTLVRATTSETIGMTVLAMADNTLKVTGLSQEGLLPRWNKDASTGDDVVKVGDIIIAVNKAYGDLTAMRAQLSKRTVVFTVQRSPESTTSTCAPPVEENPAAVAKPAAEPLPAEAKAEAAQVTAGSAKEEEAAPPRKVDEVVAAPVVADAIATESANIDVVVEQQVVQEPSKEEPLVADPKATIEPAAPKTDPLFTTDNVQKVGCKAEVLVTEKTTEEGACTWFC
eukprot:TRINITY_DN15456_c0_g1_i1.p1 TRINITY_DN15456_c0_g1~~TRINITY_DN15456_c0_g1_i1.p1  ORF type:complete len:251 (-),score=72.78 TRINITY_DN15456_c0_g1_i1:167-919(-)